MKKIPQRTCVGCKEKKEKRELIRVVHNKENEIHLDRTGKMQGRGAYLCDKKECLEKAIKSKALERALETSISEEIYKELRSVMNIDQ